MIEPSSFNHDEVAESCVSFVSPWQCVCCTATGNPLPSFHPAVPHSAVLLFFYKGAVIELTFFFVNTLAVLCWHNISLPLLKLCCSGSYLSYVNDTGSLLNQHQYEWLAVCCKRFRGSAETDAALSRSAQHFHFCFIMYLCSERRYSGIKCNQICRHQ